LVAQAVSLEAGGGAAATGTGSRNRDVDREEAEIGGDRRDDGEQRREEQETEKF
jgi:hypothetical protein